MLLNFQLHEDVVSFTGVNLSSLYDSPKEAKFRWAMWERSLMEFAASPYKSIKIALVVEEICKGNWLKMGLGMDRKVLNPFQWKYVKLNLPGTASYDPCTMRISNKMEDGRIGCDCITSQGER
jgi:hypothetical protein